MIALSVLTPAIPGRFALLEPLVAKLAGQVQRRAATDVDVELLALLDNQRRSIGAKRQGLIDLAAGRYLAFVDDDDDVADDYIDRILAATREAADVIVFDQRVLIDDEPPRRVRFGMEFQNEELGPPGTITHRQPFPACAWRTELARQGRFPDAMYGEDWGWVSQLLPLVRTQVRIDAVLHTYRFSAATTQAR